MNDEFAKRLMDLRLDRYAVDQGMMLNSLIGALSGMVGYPDKDGKVDIKTIVEAVERIHNRNSVNN